MVILPRGSFVLVMVFLLMAVTAWADASESKATAPPSGEVDDTLFDPFDDGSEDLYGDEGGMLATVADPMEGFNRAMFGFNDKLYFWVLKPVASGYRVVVPTPARVSVNNFFFNLLAPVRFVNCLLQWKWRAAEGEFCRFVVNTTAGCFGLFDLVENKPSFNPALEDFGQTLGYYTVGNGFYIVWPVFGPSTLRDTVGSIGDWALNPFSFMQLISLDAGALTSGTTNVAMFGVRFVNETSFYIGDYKAMKAAALNPYEAFRDAYIQSRNSKIAQ